MYGRFPQLSVFGKKFLEVCGAVIASALIAYLVGQTGKSVAPLAPVVYLAPADAQMLALMHNDEAALIDRLRHEAEKPAIPVAPVDQSAVQPVAAAPRPPQPASAAPSHRESQPSRAPVVAAAKRRLEEPAPVASTSASSPQSLALASSPAPLPQSGQSSNSGPQNDEPQNLTIHTFVTEAGDLVATLKQIPAWFWPAGGGLVSAAPRPPMPVGTMLPHMM
jgi:hypothetical protein